MSEQALDLNDQANSRFRDSRRSQISRQAVDRTLRYRREREIVDMIYSSAVLATLDSKSLDRLTRQANDRSFRFSFSVCSGMHMLRMFAHVVAVVVQVLQCAYIHTQNIYLTVLLLSPPDPDCSVPILMHVGLS